MKTQLGLISVCILLAGSGFALAQEGPSDALSPIREKDTLTDEDREQIRAFVTQRVSEVVGPDATTARNAIAALRNGYAGTPAFQKAYAAACLDVFQSAIQKGDVKAAARLMTLLASFNLLEANTLFINNLQDDRVGVRAAAAVGLRAMRPQLLAAGNDTYSQALEALQAAGKQEKSRATLRTVYAAMDYTNMAQSAALKTNIAALLDLLAERAQPYAQREEPPAFGADDAGLKIALQALPQMTAEQRNQLLGIAASMMRYAIEQYRAPENKLTELDEDSSQALLEYRGAVERLVLVGEQVLNAVLEPDTPPEVMERMTEQDTAGMKLAWDKWNEQLKQRLNQDFSLQEVAEPEAAEEGAAESAP